MALKIPAAKHLPSNSIDIFIGLVERATEGKEPGIKEMASVGVNGPPYEAVYSEIRESLTHSTNGLPFDKFWRFRHLLEICVHLGRVPEGYFRIFCTMTDALRTHASIAGMEDEAAWDKAIRSANSLISTGIDNPFVANHFSRAANVARSLQSLERSGYEYHIDAWGCGLTDDSFRRASADIDDLVSRLGGLNVANCIFRSLVENKRLYRGLFLFGRSVSQMPRAQNPSVPWNFIYNLALKHLTESSSSTDPEMDWQRLVRLACDLGASLDVEESSGFAGLTGISPYLLGQALLDNILYDELFSFRQWSAENAIHLCDLWIDAASQEGCQFPKGSASDWKTLANSLLSLAHPTQFTITVVWEYISSNVSQPRALLLLDTIAIDAKKLNVGYITPKDTSFNNASSYPIYKIAPGRYLLPPKGIAGRSFYERLLHLIDSPSNPQLDHKLGRSVERLAVMILKSVGCTPDVVNGRYHNPERSRGYYELDLAVTKVDCIHLLECKRKVLTRAARAGNVIKALKDFSKSFLETLVQMTRHEIIMRTQGEIQFIDGRVLSISDRRIERVTLTMLDHGSMQGRIFTRNMVNTLILGDLVSDDPSIQGTLREINITVAKLRTNLEALAEIEQCSLGEYLRRFGFGNWWLSLDQLMTLARPNVSLWEMLRPIRHTTFQTGDIMSEFAAWENISLRAAQEEH